MKKLIIAIVSSLYCMAYANDIPPISDKGPDSAATWSTKRELCPSSDNVNKFFSTYNGSSAINSIEIDKKFWALTADNINKIKSGKLKFVLENYGYSYTYPEGGWKGYPDRDSAFISCDYIMADAIASYQKFDHDLKLRKKPDSSELANLEQRRIFR